MLDVKTGELLSLKELPKAGDGGAAIAKVHIGDDSISTYSYALGCV